MRSGIMLAAMATLGGCAAGPAMSGGGMAKGLAGTNWRLVEFQSMDDAQGITRPTDASHYTIAFGADGRAALRLDCNRGTGTYTAEASSATGGTLMFGPIASTRAFCPAPSMGDALAAQLSNVRSYTLADGHLNMALMADGGIFVWEPVEAAR